ncbi:hypothetical protein EZV62_020422 [Acer yangbiense]|uniref:Pentacotripeptide-repeat region of PRORP domain-containing protein n=1 Tax=Acer yangbiense TaxID=1000413 RepID=A0A5C7HG40_9ROSI|nr:hypothetical protein EZV62_020422 [Acer yangbiense]
MKLQFSTKFLQQKHQNSCGVLASIFSTKTKPKTQTETQSSSSKLLYDRIEVIEDLKTSVVPVLDQWVSEGRSVDRGQLRNLVEIMNNLRRFNHALEISQWMTDRHNFALSPSEIAHRLDMVHRVHGIKLAEEYFNSVPNDAKTCQVYGALLNAYVQQKSVEEAEAIMQTMRVMGFATASFPYNMLITLYSQIGENDKIEVLIQEMEEKGIPNDKKTREVLMSAYIATSDISMMEMVLKWMEKDPHYVVDWKVYSIAANGYLKGRQFGSSYACMITCLAKLDDVEGAEKIFEEWESQCTAMCGNRVLISLIIAYCKEGLFEKADSAVNKALEGKKPRASLWNVLAVGYEKDNQMPKAVEMLKRAISVGKQGWSPNSVTLDACLDHLEGQEDVDGIKDMIRLLKKSGPLTRDIYHRWLRTCVAAGDSVSEVVDQMKMDGFSVDEETDKILKTGQSL